MSERAREFLDQWLAGHVEPVPDVQRLRESVRLVGICRQDAVRAGILPAQLRLAAGGDLVRSMLSALGAAAARRAETTAASAEAAPTSPEPAVTRPEPALTPPEPMLVAAE